MATSSDGCCRSRCYVGDPKSGFETLPFVRCMHAGICSTTLHQHVVAISRPCVFQRRLNHRSAVTLAAQFGVSNNVLQEAVAFSSAKEVRCGDEHTRGSNATTIIGHEDADPLARQNFLPDALGALARLRGRTYLRHLKEREE